MLEDAAQAHRKRPGATEAALAAGHRASQILGVGAAKRLVDTTEVRAVEPEERDEVVAASAANEPGLDGHDVRPEVEPVPCSANEREPAGPDGYDGYRAPRPGGPPERTFARICAVGAQRSTRELGASEQPRPTSRASDASYPVARIVAPEPALASHPADGREAPRQSVPSTVAPFRPRSPDETYKVQELWPRVQSADACGDFHNVEVTLYGSDGAGLEELAHAYATSFAASGRRRPAPSNSQS